MSPVAHIICRWAPASLLEMIAAGCRSMAATPSTSALVTSTPTTPGCEVVGEQPVGQHVGRVPAARRDEVAERAADPRGQGRVLDLHEADAFREAVGEHGAPRAVPLLARPLAPRRIGEQAALLLGAALHDPMPGLRHPVERHPAVPVHADVDPAWRHLWVQPHAARPGARRSGRGSPGCAPGRSLSQKMPLNVDTRPRGPVSRATRRTSSRHALVLTSGMNSRNAPRSTSTSRSSPSSSSSASTLGVGRLCASSSNHEVESPSAPARERLVEHRRPSRRARRVSRRGPRRRRPSRTSGAACGRRASPRSPCTAARAARRGTRETSSSSTAPTPRTPTGGMSSTYANTALRPSRCSGAQRRQRERAVADEHRGHAVLRHRITRRVPEQRGVEVRVRVDEPGGDGRAAGVEHPLACGAQVGCDLGDDTVGDADVSPLRRRAGTVDDAHRRGRGARSPRRPNDDHDMPF